MNSKKYDGIDHPVREVTDLKDIIVSSCEMFGDKNAYLQKDRPGGEYKAIKYSTVKADMDALGTRLIDLGLKGEKIALIGETSYYWFLTYFAVVSGVGVIVPLDKNLPMEEMRGLARRSGAKAIVFSRKMEKAVGGLMDEPGTLEHFISLTAPTHEEGILCSRRAAPFWRTAREILLTR